MSVEIERKWLFNYNSTLTFFDTAVKWIHDYHVNMHKIIPILTNIEQFYFMFDKTKSVRLRVETKQGKLPLTTLTIKSMLDADLSVRAEYEFEIKSLDNIESSDLLHLMDKLNLPAVKKQRIIIKMNDSLKIEVDIFKQLSLIIIEVEFADEQSRDSFVPPFWFGKEVTHDEEYLNGNIANQLMKIGE